RGKRSVVVDLKQPDGLELTLRLAEQCDVLVENFLPGTMGRLGLGYPAVSARNPRLVYASCSGFGQTGPDSKKPAYDIIVQGAAGTMSINGDADRPPTRVGFSIGDIAAGLFGALAIVAALRERDTSAQGQHIDIGMMDCQLALLENAASRYLNLGQVAERLGSSHPVSVPFSAYPTADGAIVIGASHDDEWERVCAVIGRPELAHDPRYAGRRDRVAHRSEVDGLLTEVMQTDTTAHWVERLGAVRVACGPVNTVADAIESPQAQAREMVAGMRDRSGREIRVVGTPMKLSRTPACVAGPPPELGEHTIAVLTDVLGLDAVALEQLSDRGVVVQS
ncbi:MAG: CaiB/BaiF CoA transferase family protein, partial [Chloroflexota bacterium]